MRVIGRARHVSDQVLGKLGRVDHEAYSPRAGLSLHMPVLRGPRRELKAQPLIERDACRQIPRRHPDRIQTYRHAALPHDARPAYLHHRHRASLNLDRTGLGREGHAGPNFTVPGLPRAPLSPMHPT